MSKYTSNKKHAPLDEDVVVPAAIRAAAARSDALHKQMYEEATPPAPETPPAPPANANEPPAPASETPPAPETPPADNAPVDWEARFKTMEGRYKKLITDLNSRIADLSARPRQPAPAPQPRTPDLQFKPVTQEEKDNYGEEFIDVARRAAAETLAPEISGLRAELDRLKGAVTKTEEEQARETVQRTYQYLDSEMTDWRKVNRDPKFVAWANLPDPFSGAIRMTMMREAFERGDAPRVLRFFQGFLSDEAATGPATNRTEVPTGKVPLETFAAPGRAKAPAASVEQTPGVKETITHAQIAAFYLAVNKGHYKGNEDEKNRLEKMIFEAQAEGRVI
jgi:hypothetical protein